MCKKIQLKQGNALLPLLSACVAPALAPSPCPPLRPTSLSSGISFHELSHQNFNCSYGWRWGFLSLAGFAFLGCAAGGVMGKVERPYSPSTHIPEPEVEQPMGVKARVLGTLLHPQLYARFLPRSIILKLTLFFSPVLGLFLLVCLADVVATLSLFIPFHYVPSIASDRGLTRTQGAMLISATGVCSTAGQCLFLNGTQSFLTLFVGQAGWWLDGFAIAAGSIPSPSPASPPASSSSLSSPSPTAPPTLPSSSAQVCTAG